MQQVVKINCYESGYIFFSIWYSHGNLSNLIENVIKKIKFEKINNQIITKLKIAIDLKENVLYQAILHKIEIPAILKYLLQF